MVSGTELGAVARAGVSITQGLKKASAEVEWPNAHEALMELIVIVDDWCEAARRSNVAAQEAVEAVRDGRAGQVWDDDPYSNAVYRTVGPFTIKDFIEQTAKDLSLVLSPPAPWAQRWRSSKRRSAGRRTLRSMLRIYEPDLLEAFDEAVRDRAEWVREHRRDFEFLFSCSYPIEDLLEVLEKMEETLRALVVVRERLLALVREKYPLGPPIEPLS
jgi:hypothetical protein